MKTFSRALALGLVGALLSAIAADRVRGATPPNLVLIVSDDQGWQDHGFMGSRDVRTPRLDHLASESLLFSRGYVPTSLCRPSLASLMTGRYPHETRIVGNDPQLPDVLQSLGPRDRLQDDRYKALRESYSENLDGLPMLPRLLAERGYLTLQTGKWWERDYRQAGFTHGMTHGDPARSGRHGDQGLGIGRETMQPIFDFIDEARQADKPFFVFYAPMMPHTPHNPPERLLAAYRDATPSLPLAKYRAMCEWFDETAGELLDGLDERGLTADTAVIYLVDNGWTQPLDKDPTAFGAPRGKRTPYDGGLRTPIMVKAPGLAPGRDDAHAVSSLDILPTILGIAGRAPPAGGAGLDLRDAAAVAARPAVFGATYDHDATFPTQPARTLQYRWIVAGDWKLIVPEPRVSGADVELFAISQDPEERSNLAAAQPRRAEALRALLDAWWKPERESVP